MRSALKYGSPLISLLERSGLNHLGNREPGHPPVFIIGPPRSGSTILYQLITGLLHVAYIDNLANLAWRNPFFGMRLSRKLFTSEPHKSYTSDFGQTISDGLHAPAEALFFYKWFPTDRHYTAPSDLNPDQVSEFRKSLFALINLSQMPLVIKNLSFSMRLQVLKQILPGARYIIVRRDPLFTSQSLLLAMRKNKVPEHRVWGILPREYAQIVGLEPHEMVVRQVNMIENQIYNDLKEIPEKEKLYIDYENLDSDLESILEKVTDICGDAVQRRSGTAAPEISVKNRLNLPETEIELLKSHIDRLDWDLQHL